VPNGERRPRPSTGVVQISYVPGVEYMGVDYISSWVLNFQKVDVEKVRSKTTFSSQPDLGKDKQSRKVHRMTGKWPSLGTSSRRKNNILS